ncbi:MAG: hypothetical protein ACXWX5_05920, partial [Actinomycetota bacterium]
GRHRAGTIPREPDVAPTPATVTALDLAAPPTAEAPAAAAPTAEAAAPPPSAPLPPPRAETPYPSSGED